MAYKYRTIKHPELGYSDKLKSYVYKGEKVSTEKANEIKYGWAKVDLVNGSKNDEDLTPGIKLDVFKCIVNCLPPRELVGKSQAIIYHRIKRYVACLFEYFDVTKRKELIKFPKANSVIPKLKDSDNPWSLVKYVDDALVYKNKVYSNPADENKIIRAVAEAEICMYALLDVQIEKLFNFYAMPLVSNLIEVAYKNNQMRNHGEAIYEMFKSMIVGLDADFKFNLKKGVSVDILMNRLTGLTRYSLGSK